MIRTIVELYKDAQNILSKDPAATNIVEVLLTYPGFHVLISHRTCHFMYTKGLRILPKILSQITRFFTGIEIHPGAIIGNRLFIDHGSGIVIGETTKIGDNCTIYHGVTLGGRGVYKEKRHPTIGNNVLIGCGAKILGSIEVEDNVKIGAQALVLHDCQAGHTYLGLPAKKKGKR